MQGYLSIVLIIMIVILGTAGIILARTFITSSMSSATGNLESKRAFFIAVGGGERTIQLLYNPNLANPSKLNRTSCANISGNVLLTNVPLAAGIPGIFTSTSLSPVFYPTSATAVLTNSISTHDNEINVASTVGFAPAGRIMIDREIIDYTAKTPHSFTGIVQRGIAGSRATKHNTGTRVSQFQCNIKTVANVPDKINSSAQTTLTQNVQLQEMWMAGQRGDGFIRFARWNQPEETVINNAGINVGTNSGLYQNINDLEGLNYADVWAVGNNIKLGPKKFHNIMRWEPSTQSWHFNLPIPLPPNNRVSDINSISAVSNQEAWAVGDHGYMWHFNGIIWTNINRIYHQHIFAVDVVSIPQQFKISDTWTEVIP